MKIQGKIIRPPLGKIKRERLSRDKFQFRV